MFRWRMRVFVGSVFCGSYLLCTACGGHSGLSGRGSGGASGSTTLATGGTGGLATGGTGGGEDASASGEVSGATTLGSGGTSGASGTDGSADSLSCAAVTCPSLPVSCKKIVQDPHACCPVCTDTGCDPCDEPTCAAGTHKETIPGACCPSCVVDPPDACTQGQRAYADLRSELLDKYLSSKCKNSTDCVLVLENDACGFFCYVALPSGTENNFQGNMASSAAGNCATCPPPAPVQCELMVPACVNEKCVAASPF